MEATVGERTATDLLRSVCEEMERAIGSGDRPKGGQQTGPNHGDFWPVGTSVLNRYRWWVREMRKVLDAEGGDNG